jgi:hypothetical protein
MAIAIPPLSGGADVHGGEATHAATITVRRQRRGMGRVRTALPTSQARPRRLPPHPPCSGLDGVTAEGVQPVLGVQRPCARPEPAETVGRRAEYRRVRIRAVHQQSERTWCRRTS